MTISSHNLYLSVDQLANRFGVSKDSIWRWRREGDFPKPVKLGPGTTRWRLADVEDFEKQCICKCSFAPEFGSDALYIR